MKNTKSRWLGTLFLLWSSISVYAAQTINGRVVDTTGEGVIGANVLVKGSTTGTITDFDGNYSIEVESMESTLVFSYIGFVTQEFRAKDANGRTITMKEDSELLEEVVVVGFGTQKKESLTGSVAVVEIGRAHV